VNFHWTPGRGTAGGLTPPGQTEQGIPYHVPPYWVPVGGSGEPELTHGSGARAPVRSGRAALWVVRFVLCFPLSGVAAVPVPSVRCSVTLPLPPPPGSAGSVHSPPCPGGWSCGRVALLLPAAAKP